MKKTFPFLLLIALATTQNIRAQLRIEGLHACYDSLTHTLLATVPEDFFGNTTILHVEKEEGWGKLEIAGQHIQDNIYQFQNISAERKYPFTLTANDGSTLSGNIQFTYLPILQIWGSTGYEYQNTLVLLSNPEQAATDSLTGRIKWRGASTNTEGKHKRNYKLKLDEDKSLLGMRKDNNWILDAGQMDLFRLRNRAIMDIWNSFARQPYYSDEEPKARNGVSGRIVEVFLGSEYRGFYNFSECLDRKQMKLVKADKNTGEVHGCLYKATSWGYSMMWDTLKVNYDNRSEKWNAFEVKYPDLADNDTTDWSTLYNAIDFVVIGNQQRFEYLMDDYFDMPPLIDAWILISTLGIYDQGGKNIYWAVHDKAKDKKLTPAPWDFDLSIGKIVWMNPKDSFLLPDSLLDMDFGVTWRIMYNMKEKCDEINERYHELRQDQLSNNAILRVFEQYYQLIKKSGAAKREEVRWSKDSDIWGYELDFDNEILFITNWLTAHLEALDDHLFPASLEKGYFDQLSTKNTLSESFNKPTSELLYNLQGQLMNNNTNKKLRRGIYIKNGKKVVIR